MATITFVGGAGSVTGACFLLEAYGKKIIVDCGVDQREHVCDKLNSDPFPFDVSSIDVLLVTHAHQDHIGRVPKLVKEGFKGEIFSTGATKELSAVMFDDAVKIMTQHSEEHGCDPLYESGHAHAALALWNTHDYHEPFKIGDISVEFLDAGHVLGSAMVRLTSGEGSLVFTGDLGNSPEPLLRDTESIAGAKYVVMESVYGDRVHENRGERTQRLRAAIEETRAKKGTLLIPCFALERTQILLYEIHELIEKGMQPIAVFLDAPLAERVTPIFLKYKHLFNDEAQKDFNHENAFRFPKYVEIAHSKQSRTIHEHPGPKIIIAGAGMSSGGRIREHEKFYLPQCDATVLMVGYQTPGSLGRQIQEFVRHVTIDGQRVTRRCNVQTLTGYSGHKDRDGLMEFVEKTQSTVKEVFVAMGEPSASMFFAQRVKDFLGVNAVVPGVGEKREIAW